MSARVEFWVFDSFSVGLIAPNATQMLMVEVAKGRDCQHNPASRDEGLEYRPEHASKT